MRSATPGLVDRADGVAAADDGEAVAVGDRLRDRERALGEARPLEDAHRAVPEHRLRAGDRARRSPRASPGRCRGRASRRAARRTARPVSRRRRRTTPRRRRRVGSTASNGNGFSRARPRPSCRRSGPRRPAQPRFCEHGDLVLDLRAAGDDHERPLDLAEQPRRGARARRAAAAPRRRAAGARPPRSRSARGAPSRTRR